jgi:hypothetical protein
MHLGFNNPGQEYLMDGQVLEETAEEGYWCHHAEEPETVTQCAKAARTAQTVLSQMTRAFHYRDRNIYVRLYVQYVRPHLESDLLPWTNSLGLQLNLGPVMPVLQLAQSPTTRVLHDVFNAHMLVLNLGAKEKEKINFHLIILG